MNRYGARVFPWRTPAKIQKKSVSPLEGKNSAVVLEYNILIALTIFIGDSACLQYFHQFSSMDRVKGFPEVNKSCKPCRQVL